MIVTDEPCPSCRANGRDKTGNHLMVFSDGNKHCNRCGYTEINGDCTKERLEELTEHTAKLTTAEIAGLPSFGIPHKLISAETCEHYGVRTEFNGQGEPYKTWYPHCTREKVDGYKGKTTDKKFSAAGETKAGQLFGQDVVRGGKFIVITEGEDDALVCYQVLREKSNLLDWTPAVVSLSHGSSGAVGDITRNLEFLENFEKIILCFDMDEEGQKAVRAVCPVLSGKVFIAKIGEKDANAMVLAGKGDELKWDLMKHAKKYQPDGIINGADTWERYKNSSNMECIAYPQAWTELNRMTYGFRPGSIVTITSGTGVGKTQFLRELKYHVFNTTDWGIADISLEEDVGDSVAGIMSLHVGQRLHLPDVEIEEDREREVHAELFSSGRFSFYDHFGGMDDSSLFNKLRYFGATGHKAIFLDHLSIIVSEYAAEGGERERIDTVMTKLAKLAKELEVVIFLVVHLRKEGSGGAGRSFERGGIPSLDDLRGSASLKQLSYDVFALSRDQQHLDPICRDITKVTVLKCRFTGRTGPADFLRFYTDTGRMVAVDEPKNYEEERNF